MYSNLNLCSKNYSNCRYGAVLNDFLKSWITPFTFYIWSKILREFCGSFGRFLGRMSHNVRYRMHQTEQTSLQINPIHSLLHQEYTQKFHTSVRLQIDLIIKWSAISLNLGIYWVRTKMPAPIIAIWGGAASEAAIFPVVHYGTTTWMLEN